MRFAHGYAAERVFFRTIGESPAIQGILEWRGRKAWLVFIAERSKQIVAIRNFVINANISIVAAVSFLRLSQEV